MNPKKDSEYWRVRLKIGHEIDKMAKYTHWNTVRRRRTVLIEKLKLWQAIYGDIQCDTDG